jgi:hypothetical protein
VAQVHMLHDSCQHGFWQIGALALALLFMLLLLSCVVLVLS